MSTPITTRERRLEIIAQVSTRMAAERRALGRERDAQQIEEFFVNMAHVVGGTTGHGAPSWATAGLFDAEPTASDM